MKDAKVANCGSKNAGCPLCLSYSMHLKGMCASACLGLVMKFASGAAGCGVRCCIACEADYDNV